VKAVPLKRPPQFVKSLAVQRGYVLSLNPEEPSNLTKGHIKPVSMDKNHPLLVGQPS
jgi:hypothetical protein